MQRETVCIFQYALYGVGPGRNRVVCDMHVVEETAEEARKGMAREMQAHISSKRKI